MVVKGSPCSLLPGDPQGAPAHAVHAEALISLLRRLHACPGAWRGTVGRLLLQRLQHAGLLARRLMAAQPPEKEEGSSIETEMSIDIQIEQEENLQKEMKKQHDEPFTEMTVEDMCKEVSGWFEFRYIATEICMLT